MQFYKEEKETKIEEEGMHKPERVYASLCVRERRMHIVLSLWKNCF